MRNSWLSQFLLVGPNEEILVRNRGECEKVAGRCLGFGELITYDSRRYKVVSRSAERGAVLRECNYAPAF